jgi:SAM-dependent methyltransferase
VSTNLSGMGKRYAFNSDTDLGREHLEYLSTMLDDHSFAQLDAIGVKPGQRCLDLGSGAGTIANHLAERTGPDGQVVAVDLATDHLVAHPRVEVYRHDINDGVPVAGSFDLIHARLLLLHLPRRQEILAMLADALAPGGWLVLTEFTGPQQRVVTAPSEADELFFYSMQERAHSFAAKQFGASYEWAYDAGRCMATVGLANIGSRSFSRSHRGGEAGWMLMRNLYRQLADVFVTNGVLTEDELVRFDDLLLDPRFSAWIYTVVTTRGQRPIS